MKELLLLLVSAIAVKTFPSNSIHLGVGAIYKGANSENVIEGLDGKTITSSAEGGAVSTNFKPQQRIISEPAPVVEIIEESVTNKVISENVSLPKAKETAIGFENFSKSSLVKTEKPMPIENIVFVPSCLQPYYINENKEIIQQQQAILHDTIMHQQTYSDIKTQEEVIAQIEIEQQQLEAQLLQAQQSSQPEKTYFTVQEKDSIQQPKNYQQIETKIRKEEITAAELRARHRIALIIHAQKQLAAEIMNQEKTAAEIRKQEEAKILQHVMQEIGAEEREAAEIKIQQRIGEEFRKLYLDTFIIECI